jgi:hypothetical protein
MATQTGYSALELVQMILKRIPRPFPVTFGSLSTDAQFVLDALNLAYAELSGMGDWDWLRAEANINILKKISTTFTVTPTLATFTCTPAIVTTTAATSAPYLGAWAIPDSGSYKDVMVLKTLAANGLSGAFQTVWPTGYDTTLIATVVQPQYQLPADFDRPIDQTSFITTPWLIKGLDTARFLQTRQEDLYLSPTGLAVGIPSVCTVWGQADPSGTTYPAPYLHVYPFPEKDATVRLSYFKRPAKMTGATDVPLIPQGYQHALIERVLQMWYRDKQVDQVKKAACQASFDAIMAQMLGQTELTSERVAVQPESYR